MYKGMLRPDIIFGNVSFEEFSIQFLSDIFFFIFNNKGIPSKVTFMIVHLVQ